MTHVPAIRKEARALTRSEILSYGNNALMRIESINSEIDSRAKLSDLDDMGKVIEELLAQTQKFDPSYKAKILGLIPRSAASFVRRKATVNASVESLTRTLDTQVDSYRQQITQLGDLYQANYDYYLDLQGQIHELDASIEFMKANPPEIDPEDPFSAQLLNRHENTIMLAEQRSDQLRRSSILAEQAGPQIELMALNAQKLSETFDDLQHNAVPTMRRTASMYLVNSSQLKGSQIAAQVKQAARKSLEANGRILLDTTKMVHEGMNDPTYRNVDLEKNEKIITSAATEMNRLCLEARANMTANRLQLKQSSKNVAVALIGNSELAK